MTHCTFQGATFSCKLSFVRCVECKFTRCVFAYNGFYGSVLDNCTFDECDFWDGNRITNTDFKSVRLSRCLVPENIFFDCRFDERTVIRELQETPLIMTQSSVRLEKVKLASIYTGIKEAYAAGNCISLTRGYHYRAMQSSTRYNSGNWRVKVSGLLLELLTGYGVKPIRVLIAMEITFLLSLAWFVPKVGLNDALMLVSGAMFTFGAFSELIKPLGLLSRIVYIATAFAGVSGTALFVTVWAVKWLRD